MSKKNIINLFLDFSIIGIFILMPILGNTSISRGGEVKASSIYDDLGLKPTLPPLDTPTGKVTSDIKYPDKLETESNLDNLLKSSDLVNLDTTSNADLLEREYYNETQYTNEYSVYNIDVSKLNLDGKIYHYRYNFSPYKIDDGENHVIDEFVQVVCMYIDENGQVVRVFDQLYFQDGSRAAAVLRQEDSYQEDLKPYLRQYVTNKFTLDEPIAYFPSDEDVYEKLGSYMISNKRLAGDNRLDTSLKIASEYAQAQGGEFNNAVISYGYNFADALAGSTLAKKLDCPVFLVKDMQDSLLTLDTIRDNMLKEGHVYILGGSAVVPDEFKDWLVKNGIDATHIIRYGGANREETASKIADAVKAPEGTPVVIASEENFPDALSISPIAASKGYPILLTRHDVLPEYIKEYIVKHKPSKIYIAGGTASVSEDVVDEVKSTCGLEGDSIKRLAGSDRYGTSLAIANEFKGEFTNATVVSGNDYPDAISGSVLSAKNKSPILLVNDDYNLETYIDRALFEGDLNTSVIHDNDVNIAHIQNFIADNKIKNIYFLGGKAVLSQYTVNKIALPEEYARDYPKIMRVEGLEYCTQWDGMPLGIMPPGF
ncbi:cell wall-binding repeat-containing protein [Clostridium sp. JNZ X4-2]